MWNWRTTSGSTQDQSAASAMSSDGQAPPELLVDSSAMGSDAVHDSTCDPALADPSTVPVATPATPAALFGSDTDTVAVVENVATHIVFVIDRSGSMGISDVRPRSAKFSVSRNHKNRLGCVYEAILRFVQTRMKARQADVVSVVLFDDDAIVAVEGKPISERVVDSLLDYGPGGGTSYSAGLLEARAVMQRVSRVEGAQEKHPVVMFLSDGGNNGFGTDPVEIVRQMREDDSRLLVNTIHFGSSYDDHDQQLLRDMAAAGDGTAGQGAGRPEPAASHGGEVTPTQGTGPGGGGRGRWRPAWAGFRPAPARGSYQVSTTGVGDLSDRFERLANDMSSSDGSRW